MTSWASTCCRLHPSQRPVKGFRFQSKQHLRPRQYSKSGFDEVLPQHSRLRLFNHIRFSLDQPNHQTRNLPPHNGPNTTFWSDRHQLRVLHWLVQQLFRFSGPLRSCREVDLDRGAERADTVQDVHDSPTRVRRHIPHSIDARDGPAECLGIGNNFSLFVKPGGREETRVGTAAGCVNVDVYNLDGVI